MNLAVIANIQPGSLADSIGLKPGDGIISINDNQINDLIDFQLLWADEELVLEVLTSQDKRDKIHVSKSYDQSLGAVFESAVFDGIHLCANNCIFCFVNQMPGGLRESLYIKDDDYRLSFLQGSYVTLTNLTVADINRIKRLRLSPLYVSVHAADPLLRAKLLGRKAPDDIIKRIKDLAEAGIEFHTQVVLCPGYNDGAKLEQTYEMLKEIQGVLSMAVVPVGLTSFREGLSELRLVNKTEARVITDWVSIKQHENLLSEGARFIWASDEFYIIGESELPSAESYEDFVQYENGVGLIAGFYEDFDKLKWPVKLEEPRRRIICSGESANLVMSKAVERYNQIEGFTLERKILKNVFFGPSVTVTGLLTGACLCKGLKEVLPGSVVCLPETVLLNGEGKFLDGMTIDDVEKELNVRLSFFPMDAKSMQEILLYG